MRVLVVEDDPEIARHVRKALDTRGYVSTLSQDGEDGWFRAETEDYDAIVLDLGLPKMDGLSVVRRLRDANIVTPILILTARGAWMERVEGIDAGADDYLTKPFHTEELMARLGALVRRSAGHVTPTLKHGEMTVDTRRRIVHVAAREIEVSALEFRTLRYLMHHAGRCISQGELIEHVYGSGREPDSNTMEVMIARLRRKLGNDAITTRRGHGYGIGL
jgi:two-component system, OmpR family, response regulator